MNWNRSALIFLLILTVMALAACGGGNEAPASSDGGGDTVVASGDADHGEDLYNQVCVACHGPEGVGMENLGKPFNTSEFIRGSSEEDLVDFVKVGRPISDPVNTTGVDMPPKGGNPALTDEDIIDIIAYIRTLQ